jgi:hypothetical protein
MREWIRKLDDQDSLLALSAMQTCTYTYIGGGLATTNTGVTF